MNVNKMFFRISSLLFLCCVFSLASSQQVSNDVYQATVVAEKDLAKRPVVRLKDKIEHRKFELIKGEFVTKLVCDKFLDRFKMREQDKIIPGCFKRPVLEITIGPPIKIGTGLKADHKIDLKIVKSEQPTHSIIATCTTSFDAVAEEYLIKEVEIIGVIPGLECPEIPDPPVPVPPPDPVFLESGQCQQNPASEFLYIKLRSRASSGEPVDEGGIIGENEKGNLILIPEDFHEAVAFRQTQFEPFSYSTVVTIDVLIQENIINPLYEACLLLFNDFICSVTNAIAEFILQSTIVEVAVTNLATYNAGYVISSHDARENGAASLFLDVFDADGVIEVLNSSGATVSRSVGFFLDRDARQIVAVSSTNDILKYGLGVGEYRFQDPVAITASGKFLYILDRGVTNSIIVLKYSLNSSDILIWSLVGTTNFGSDFSFATDITSFENTNEILLYVANPSANSLTLVTIDKSTGLQKSGAPDPKEYFEYVTANGEILEIGSITKVESSPRNATNGRNTILSSIGQDKITAFSHDALMLNSDLTANFRYKFPPGAGLRNIGYNKGNNAFYIADIFNDDIHIFSHDGEYIASSGTFGGSENNNEFYDPKVISSNTFTSSTKDVVVGSRWGSHSGFKKVRPLADISNICIVEKAPNAVDDLEFNSLDLQYSLTDGEGVDQIILEINNVVVKTLVSSTTDFSAGVFSNNFNATINGLGLLDELVVGWNTYTVMLDAHVDVGTGSISYQKSVTREFYIIPSSFDADFVVGNTNSADLFHDNSDDPFVVYKNVWISGDDDGSPMDFTIKNGTTWLWESVILTVNKPTEFLVENEEIQFKCGANLRLIMEDGTGKLLTGTTFNGTLEADRMVMCYGDFTGNTSVNSAGSSDLEFIDCDFINYYGTALHLAQGRATLAEVSFQPGPSESFLATSILVSPDSRLDMFGGGIFESDIGIDAVMADLFIGLKTPNYKGTAITKTRFDNNKIVINSVETDCSVEASSFENNGACFIHLSGSLLMDNNSFNTFEGNIQAIVFSDDLDISGGKNKFVNNVVDITYVMPLPIAQSTAVVFDVECNLWQHGSTVDQPSFDIKSDPAPYNPASGLVEFDYTPYLEFKGSGILACTGGVTGGGGNQGNHKKKIKFQSSFHAECELITANLGNAEYNEAYNNLVGLIMDEDHNMALSHYPSKFDTVRSYQESVLKGLGYGYLLKMNDLIDIQDLPYVTEMINKLIPAIDNSTTYSIVRKDKLEFLKFFINATGRIYYNEEDDPYRELVDKNLATLEVYPNPASLQESRIEIRVKKASKYTLVAYNAVGHNIGTVFEGRKINQGLNVFNLDNIKLEPGIIFLQLIDNKSSSLVNKKIIVIK